MSDRSASMPMMKAVRAPADRYDVAVLGGGLAGLCMALQLRRQRPDTNVLLVDKRAEEPPQSTFKVGESTVEVGAHYFRQILGMADHLDSHQLRKKGLRFYVSAGDNSDISKRVEFATPPSAPNVYTHQIDRGVFETELFARCVAAGADAFRGWRVQDVELGSGSDDHRITISHEDETRTVSAHWVVDATGRFNLLRRKLDLDRPVNHHVNAAWFRLKGGMNIEDWTDDAEWKGRTYAPDVRKQATGHLAGQGYWIWMIDLSTGPISIGLVADPRFHPFDQINEFDRLLNWLSKHEPQLAAAVEPRLNDVMDFLVIEDFSYASTHVFSPDRWTLTGEAAAFIDPLYSPGSDFIAYLNSFGGDLICRELDGEDIEERMEFFQFFFDQLFDPTFNLYQDMYQLFGNAQVMMCKLLYDNMAYFSTLAFLFLHDKMTALEDLGDVVDIFQTIIPLLGRMQELYRDWHEIDQRKFEGMSVQSIDFEPFRRAQREMGEPFELEEMIKVANAKVEVLKAIAVWTFHLAAKQLPEPPDPERPINALAVSLKPEKWAEEGLFDDGGMTLAQARELLPGIEEYDLEARSTVAVG